MDDALIWILIGLILVALEALIPGVYLLWIGLAMVGSGLYAWAFGASFGTKVVVFLVLLAAGVAAALRLKRRQGREASVNAPEAGLVGRIGTLVLAEPARTRVRVGDTEWSARVAGKAEPGDAVRVEGVDGTTLVVRRLPDGRA